MQALASSNLASSAHVGQGKRLRRRTATGAGAAHLSQFLARFSSLTGADQRIYGALLDGERTAEDPRRGLSGGQLGDGLAVQVDGLHSAEGADVGVGIAIDDNQVRVVADADPSLAVAQAAGAGRDRGG